MKQAALNLIALMHPDCTHPLAMVSMTWPSIKMTHIVYTL